MKTYAQSVAEENLYLEFLLIWPRDVYVDRKSPEWLEYRCHHLHDYQRKVPSLVTSTVTNICKCGTKFTYEVEDKLSLLSAEE